MKYIPGSDSIPVGSVSPSSSSLVISQASKGISTTSSDSVTASPTSVSVSQTVQGTTTSSSGLSPSLVSTTLSTSKSSGTSSSQQAITTSSNPISSISLTVISSSSTSTSAAPSSGASNGAYKYAGCYTEATKGRALSGKSQANDQMTIENCLAFCQGYVLFGLEYGRECKFPRTGCGVFTDSTQVIVGHLMRAASRLWRVVAPCRVKATTLKLYVLSDCSDKRF